MRHIPVILCLILLAHIRLGAKERCDTLYTPDRDLVVIRYSIENIDDKAVVTFKKPQLGLQSDSKFRKKYGKNLDKVRAIIFERKGGYNDTKFDGMNVVPFSVPHEMKFAETIDGYYILNEGQTNQIVFKWSDVETASVELPIFLAMHKKKNNYEVLCQTTNPLKVELNKYPGTPGTKRDGSASRTVEREVVVTTEEDDDDENIRLIEISNCINVLRDFLEVEEEYPFSEQTVGEYNRLLTLQNGITDDEILAKISDIQARYQSRMKELKERQKQQQADERAAAEIKAQQEAEAQIKMQEEQQNKQEKRTLWMIIGGAILAMLALVGNNLFQRFNQKSIMEQTLNAQGEAKLRAREIVRNKTHQMVNKGKSKLRKQINANNDNDANKPNGVVQTDNVARTEQQSVGKRPADATSRRQNGSLNRQRTNGGNNGRISI